MPKAQGRTQKGENKSSRWPPTPRAAAIEAISQHPRGDRSHSKANGGSMAGPRLRKGAIPGEGAKPGTDIRHQNERGAKPGIAKKMEPTGGTFGRRATAAFWFKAKANISVESVVRSYACGICICAFPTEEAQQRHERKDHKEALAYTKAWPEGTDQIPKHFCTICRKLFYKGEQLWNHRRRNHSKHELMDALQAIPHNKCNKCGRGHHTNNALKKHKSRCKFGDVISKASEDL